MRKLFTKITLLLCALLLSVNMLGNTISSANSSKDVKNGKIEMKGNHATFYLSGVSAYEDNWRSSKAYAIGTVGKQSSKTLTLSWVADGDYDIKVTNIRFYAKAYTSGEWAVKNGKIVVAGSKYTIGTINPGTGGFDEINESGAFTDDISIVCKNNESGIAGYSFDYFIKNITITYTATPKIQTKTGNVELTICPEAPKTIDLNTCITNNDNHLSYTFSCTAEGANIEETTFSASRIGDYTVNVAVGKEDNCHEAASTSFTVTVTTAALTLTAPTASDITYRQALSASVLSGGLAKAGDCVVEGSWTWKDPKTTPSIGDNQPFTVVFTPFENAGNYTNFETTATINVKRAQFVFDGGGTEDDDPKPWCFAENWAENQIPGSEDQVLIDHNVVIRQEVSVYSVTITEGDTLTIMPTGGLTVGAGGIIGATTGNLILKAGTEGETKGQTGYLRISPEYTGAMPQATVELFSIGYVDYELGGLSNLMAWQYVGYPIQESVKAKSIFDGWIYSWSEEDGAWKNTRKNLMLQPFEGYATTQDYETEGLLMKFEGHLVANTTRDIPLAYSSESALPGWNAVANSFSAPIDITKMTNDDFSDGVEATIYIFNTGSTEHAEAGIEGAGQYIPIPINLANTMQEGFLLPAVIPSMQGFFVNTTKAGTMTLNYSNIVWNAGHANKPLRVRTQKTENSITGALCVSVSSNGWSDNLYLLESDAYSTEYENGYDATKRMSGSFNVFAVEEANLAVDATNSIEGTRIGVRTGEEMTYTMTFSHINSEENWMLWDKEAGFKMILSEDAEYTFNAAPNSEITERFQIIAADIPAVTTGVDEVESEVHIQKFVKDNQLYILKDGVLYNASGAVVRK